MLRDDFVALALVSDTDSCIMWPFAVRKSSGYGAHNTPRPEKRNVDAHRHVCTLAHGVAPTNLHEAAHACGWKLCINPKHLSWQLHIINMADAVNAGTLRGGGRGRQRLFAREREYIKSSGKSLLVLASEFDMEPSHIGRVRREVA